MSHLAAAIDLIDLGTFVQVHLRVFRPSVDTVTSTIDGGQIALRLVRPYGRRDVHLGEEGTTFVVVTTIDLADACLLTRVIIVHDGLNDIAGWQDLGTVSTTEDIIDLDGRFRGHIHHGTCCHTLVVAASVGSCYLPMEQIDNGRDTVAIKAGSKGLCLLLAHAQTIIATSSEDLHSLEFRISIRDVDKHIAAILCLVIVSVSRITGSTAKDGLQGVMCMILRTDIYKRAVLLRHGSISAIESSIIIVIRAVATTEDGIHPTLQVLHIR